MAELPFCSVSRSCLNISIHSFPTRRSSDLLPYKRLGQKTYYTEEDVMQFVENNVKEFKKENVEHYLTRIHQKYK